jgi:hypothetical protein
VKFWYRPPALATRSTCASQSNVEQWEQAKRGHAKIEAGGSKDGVGGLGVDRGRQPAGRPPAIRLRFLDPAAMLTIQHSQ